MCLDSNYNCTQNFGFYYATSTTFTEGFSDGIVGVDYNPQPGRFPVPLIQALFNEEVLGKNMISLYIDKSNQNNSYIEFGGCDDETYDTFYWYDLSWDSNAWEIPLTLCNYRNYSLLPKTNPQSLYSITLDSQSTVLTVPTSIFNTLAGYWTIEYN